MNRIFLSHKLVCLLLLMAFQARAAHNPQFTFSYWNDNFAYQKQLSSLIPPGDDDFMTASWRLEIQVGDSTVRQGGEFYYAIFTNRDDMTRFDILAGRWFREFQQEQWKIKYGLGALLRGNFGGAKIQNAFHDWQGYERLELEYLPEDRVGLLVYGRIARDIAQWKLANLQMYSSTALRIGAGPSNFRLGLEYETNQPFKEIPLRWLMMVRVGYAYYVQPNQIIEPYFSRGPVFGLLVGLQFADSYGAYLWITENQYGLSDPHYGLTLSYRSKSLISPKLHSIMFP